MKTVYKFLFLAIVEAILMIVFKIIFKKKRVRKGVSTITMIVGTVAFVATLFLVIMPPHENIATTGTHEVESTDYWVQMDIKDPFSKKGERRELQVRKWYPADSIDGVEDLPIVVASHGSCGTIDNNISLYKELASNGYIVLAVGHPGHAASIKHSNGKKAKVSSAHLSELGKVNPNKDIEVSYEIFKEWMDIRLADLNAVMDDYISRSGECKFVALGHSAGGSAAYGIARLRKDVVAAIALESPFMYDIKGTDGDEYIFDESPYGIPLMNVYSDSSYNNLSRWAQYEENVHLIEFETDEITNVYYKGVRHMGLCDLSLESPIFSAILDGAISEVEASDQLALLNSDVLYFLSNLS